MGDQPDKDVSTRSNDWKTAMNQTELETTIKLIDEQMTKTENQLHALALTKAIFEMLLPAMPLSVRDESTADHQKIDSEAQRVVDIIAVKKRDRQSQKMLALRSSGLPIRVFRNLKNVVDSANVNEIHRMVRGSSIQKTRKAVYRLLELGLIEELPATTKSEGMKLPLSYRVKIS
jgi:hypothetical protein